LGQPAHKYCTMPFLDSKYTNWYDAVIVRAQNRALPRDEYYEKHHIIPKSLGGSNKKENIAKLTAREHFICHWLLTKMVSDKKEKYQMWNAFSCMLYRENANQERYKISSRVFEAIKLAGSKIKKEKMSGINNPMYGKRGHLSPSYGKKRTSEQLQNYSDSHKGVKRSMESRLKQSATNKNKPKSEAHCLKVSQSLMGEKNPMYGKKLSAEAIAKRTASLQANKFKKKIEKILAEGMIVVREKKNANLTRLLNGNHPSQQKRTCYHCNTTVSLGMFGRWHSQCNENQIKENQNS